MENRHWNDDDLLAGLYDVGPADGHLAECSDCRQRWEWFQNRREQLLAAEPAVSESLLAEQRRMVLTRLAHHRGFLHLQPASVLAALLLVCVILTVFRHTPKSTLTGDTAADEQIFEEVYSMASSPEPQAVEPMQSLFEESQ